MGNNVSLKKKTLLGAKITTAITAYKVLIELAANIVLIRILAPDVFGAMAFAHIVVNLGGMFATISSNRAIIQKKDEKIENYLDVAFTAEFLLSILAAIILFITAPYIMDRLGKPELSFFTQMISLTLPINTLAFPNVIFIRKLDFKKANIVPAISIPINVIITVLAAILGLGIWSFFWGAIASSIASAIVVWKIIPYRPRIHFDSKILKELSKFGLPLTGSSLLAYYYWNVDDFMVGTMSGTEQLGYYWLAFKIPHYILNAQNGITSVVFPAFARTEDDNQLRRGFEFATRFSAIVLLLPCAIVLVLGEPTVKFLFGERWLPALFPFQIFMALITVRGTVVYWTQVLMVKGKTAVLLKITIVNAVVLTLLGYFFTKNLGIAGTATAVFLTIIISLPYMTGQLKKCIEVSYLKILWRGTISFFLTLIAGLFLKKAIPSPDFPVFLIEVALLVVIYAGFIALLDNKFSQTLKEIIKAT